MLANAITCALAVASHLYFQRYEPSVTKALFVTTLLPFILSKTLESHFLPLYCLFISTLLISIAAYRLSPNHPLANIPGPFLWKLTKLSSTWVYWRGRFHIVDKELHDIYGPMVRTGPNEISISDMKDVSQVLSASGLNLPKGGYYSVSGDPKSPESLFLITGQAHTKRRRLWNRGMNTEAVQEYRNSIAKRTTQLIARLEKEAEIDQPIDLSKWLNYAMSDIIGDIAFGGGFEFMAKGTDDGFWRWTHFLVQITMTLCNVPWLSRFAFSLPLVSVILNSERRKSNIRALARAQSSAKTKDLWYYLTDEAGKESETPSIESLSADGNLAIIAGVDTSTNAMATLLFLVLSDKDIYTRLQKEIDTAFTVGDSPLVSTRHDEVPFFMACLNEALRLQPPSPTAGPRQVPYGSEPQLVAGHALPAGTQVWTSHYTRHRNPAYFYNPDSFLPERWLTANDDNQQAFTPFSLGPANCVGKNLAKHQTLMILGTLLQSFDIEFPSAEDSRKLGFDRETWIESIQDHFVSSIKPLYVKIRRRT